MPASGRGNKKGQASLETALVFILIVLLLGQITKVWLWMNNQIVQRQKRYNATRVQAGQASEGYHKPVWPVYQPPKLSD